jgi:hypothetical protein
MTQTRSILYDGSGNPTEHESAAVRGEVVELDAEGNIVARHPDSSWAVDPISLDGDEGELATRPTEPPSRHLTEERDRPGRPTAGATRELTAYLLKHW